MTNDIYETTEIPAAEREKIEEFVIDMDPKSFAFYEKLRRKAKDWSKDKGGKIGNKLGEYLFLLPDIFILLTRLMKDKRVPIKRKLMVGGIISYIILPIDIIPDFIPMIGYVDDLVLAVMGLKILINDTDPQVLAENWSGEGQILNHVQKILDAADKFLDKNIMSRIKQWLRKMG